MCMNFVPHNNHLFCYVKIKYHILLAKKKKKKSGIELTHFFFAQMREIAYITPLNCETAKVYFEAIQWK